MKSQKSTFPIRMMKAITSVATAFKDWATTSTDFFETRSASTPPHKENMTWGIMKDMVTHPRSTAEEVNS